LNPHQIDAARFALLSPFSKGVLLADVVGLGKTIEAGLLLCHFWQAQATPAVICPARAQAWSLDCTEKFHCPT
jgi:SNF2 family DNA or RNA helicase